MLLNPKDENSERVYPALPQAPPTLTREQQDIQHMMSCRNNDCRRCNG